jgi:hypothetical protein
LPVIGRQQARFDGSNLTVRTLAGGGALARRAET